MHTRRYALIAGFTVLCELLAGCASTVASHRLSSPTSTSAPSPDSTRLTSLVSTPHCGASLQPVPILALTASGAVDALDPTTLRVKATMARAASPDLGIAMRPELDVAYVTARGLDGLPAVWAMPIGQCHNRPVIVEQNAELPSVSPDGSDLGFVTLDSHGHQTGVAVVALTASGRPAGTARPYPATATPPPLSIDGLAVGRDDAALAVWGGFVDSYLGSKRITVGTLEPATATSLGSLTAVFDEEGISIPILPAGQPNYKPEDWQATPVYLPNGELLVNDGSRDISLPFTDTTPGESGGGIRFIVGSTGAIISLAAGENGSLVFLHSDGTLTMAIAAVDLPFGPGASTPPSAPPLERTAPGRFTAVAWTEGPAAENTSLPTVFHTIAHLPNVVNLSALAAATLLNGLGLPVFVAKTLPDHAVPSGTVLAQNPSAGIGVDCQCSVALTVSSNS